MVEKSLKHFFFINNTNKENRMTDQINIDVLRNYLNNTKDDWNYITPISFYNNYYITDKPYLLIDLRTPEEFRKMHIKGAHNIFWLNILDEQNLKKLPKDRPIFLICYVGHTSSQVMTLLKLLGYKVTSIKFGYGLSPVKGIPVAGWLDYGLPIEPAIC
jgi:rhodanese-related sulfurtransferase